MPKVLLIPSSKFINEEAQRQFGRLPCVLYPLNGKTMLERIYEKHKNYVDEFFVTGCEGEFLLKNFIEWKNLPITIISMNETEQLGDSILFGLEYITAKINNIEQVIINFGDTLVDGYEIDKKDAVYFELKPYTKEWTFFRINENSEIDYILDKKSVAPSADISLHHIFVGLFSISKPYDFVSIMKNSKNENLDCDYFYYSLKLYSEKNEIKFLKSNKWIDVGHSENIPDAKTAIAARSFNTVQIDENRGLLIKRSENTDKFLNEITWYLKMPKELQYLLPRIFDYSLDLEDVFIQMEYYGYHTLHELLIFGKLPLVRWQQIFMKLNFIINDMSQYKFCGAKKEVAESLKDMYIEKTLLRLNKLKSDEKFKTFFSECIYVNDKMYPSLDNIIEELPCVVENKLIKNFDGSFNIIHGDLCFANILIEENLNFFKIIDPRGQFGSFDIYGDGRYEMAKLFHSLEGGYDFIIEDMFKIEVEGNKIKYEFPQETEEIFYVFKGVFTKELKDVDAVRMIEALLFLSMIPLHSDYINRQYAMLATGLQLWEKSKGGY